MADKNRQDARPFNRIMNRIIEILGRDAWESAPGWCRDEIEEAIDRVLDFERPVDLPPGGPSVSRPGDCTPNNGHDLRPLPRSQGASISDDPEPATGKAESEFLYIVTDGQRQGERCRILSKSGGAFHFLIETMSGERVWISADRVRWVKP